MTKEEFEIGYCEMSRISLEEYTNAYNLITLPCSCHEEHCKGWAAVDNTPLSIKAHGDLYM